MVETLESHLQDHPICEIPRNNNYIKTKVFQSMHSQISTSFYTTEEKGKKVCFQLTTPTSIDRLLMKCAWGCVEKALFFSKIAHFTPKGVQGKIQEYQPKWLYKFQKENPRIQSLTISWVHLLCRKLFSSGVRLAWDVETGFKEKVLFTPHLWL